MVWQGFDTPILKALQPAGLLLCILAALLCILVALRNFSVLSDFNTDMLIKIQQTKLNFIVHFISVGLGTTPFILTPKFRNMRHIDFCKSASEGLRG